MFISARTTMLSLIMMVSLAGFADFAFSANNQHQGISLVINELMASNGSTIKDPQGQYDDWIEIYNSGQSTINVGGMYLTDDLSAPAKWRIPDNNPSATTIPSRGYLLIWADNDTADAGLHANFKLDAGGEEIGLFGTNGSSLIDSITFGEQAAGLSYGRYPNGGDTLQYMATPTPGNANNSGYLGFVAEPEFSHSRDFYDVPFSVSITTTTGGATIYYTLDGSEPGTISSSGQRTDRIYTGPISISKTTCLRAVAIKSGFKSSNVVTHTYIFVDDVARQPPNPPGWPSDWGYSSDVDQSDGSGNGIVPADYEMDPRVVNSTLPGYSIRDALLDIPTMSISMLLDDFISDATGIYANPQSLWERKCSVEYILPDGTEGFQHDCKIEVHGNASRRPYRMQKHSFRLTFTSLYGPSKLKYQLFPESIVDEFNQLILRAGFTDSWALVSWSSSSRYRPNDSQYTRDVWMKESLRDMGQPSSCGSYVHLYVDGLYFGLYNLTERVGDDFFADHLGGQPEEWEINEDLSGPGARWRAMMSIDPATPAGYRQIQDYLDVENFADYMLLHFYADAEDWPHHNGYAAANAISGDGKFRFFVWDQEIVLDYHGRAASRIDSTSGAGDVFQKMRTSEEFRLLFADRVYKHCFNNGALSVTASKDRYLNIANQIDKAIVAESARWGDTQMSTPYGNAIEQPVPPTDINHNLYPPAPHGPDYYFTREDSWVVERDNVIYNYIPAIHNTANSYAIIKVLRAENLYPNIDPPVLNVNGTYQHGGHISSAERLSMSTSVGAIYYTLDGSDPSLPGTSQAPTRRVSTSAIRYTTPITLTKSTLVKSRVLDGSTWSALNEATFAVGPVAQNLRVTEIMYHPKETNDPNEEFIELKNIGTATINLNLVRFTPLETQTISYGSQRPLKSLTGFTNGIDFTFPDIILAAGGYTLVVKDRNIFTARYGTTLNIAGQYIGSLSDAGERIRLEDALGNVILDFEYSDGWRSNTDGGGSSLTIIDATNADLNSWGQKGSWSASLPSPGR